MTRKERKAERWRLYRQFFRLVDSYDPANIDLAIAMMTNNRGLRDVAKNRYYPIMRALDSSIGSSWHGLKEVRHSLEKDKTFKAKFVLRYAQLGEVETALALTKIASSDFIACRGIEEISLLALLEELGHEAVKTEIQVNYCQIAKYWSWGGGYYADCDICPSSQELQRLLGLTIRHLRHAKGLKSYRAEIADWLGHFNSLESLTLLGCELEEFPAQIANLRQLKAIKINHSPIKVLPRWLFELEHLAELEANYCQLERIEIDEALQSSNIKTLDLHKNALASLPPAMARLRMMTYLDVGHNPLAVVPSWIFDLSFLKQLRAPNCQLSRLEINSANSSGLRELTLDNNPLKVLPSAIFDLERLDYLRVEGCQLEEIKLGDAPKCGRLSVLELSNNALRELPEALGDFVFLYKLGMAKNAIRRLPSWIFDLPNLGILAADDCRLEEIEINASPKGLKLRELRLQNNALSELPPAMVELLKLNSLSLRGNPIKALPNWICEMKELKYLEVDEGVERPC